MLEACLVVVTGMFVIFILVREVSSSYCFQDYIKCFFL